MGELVLADVRRALTGTTRIRHKPLGQAQIEVVKPIKSREDALKAVDNTSTVFFVVAGIQAIIGLAVAASFSKSAFDLAINAGLIGVGLYVAFASWLRWGRSRFAALLLLLMAFSGRKQPAAASTFGWCR